MSKFSVTYIECTVILSRHLLTRTDQRRRDQIVITNSECLQLAMMHWFFSAQNNVPNIRTHMDACTHTHSWHAHIQACTKYIMHACTPTCMHATTHTQRLIAKEQLSVRTMANCSSAGGGVGEDLYNWPDSLNHCAKTVPVAAGTHSNSSCERWQCKVPLQLWTKVSLP